LPDASLWRTRLAVSPLWQNALQLSLLQKPLLPQMPWPTDSSLAPTGPATFIALWLLSVDLHLAPALPGAGPLAPQTHLQPAHQQRRRSLAKTGLGSWLCRRPTRDARGSAHLDASLALSSARPPARQRRGLI